MTTALQVHRAQLDKVAAQFQAALPVTARKFLTPERITQVVCTALSQSPKLLECSPRSILKGTMDCVQVGLEPGGPLGHAYLVPFKNKKTGTMEATPIIGYKGYVTLAMRSGILAAPPIANLVRESDHFEMDLGGGQPPVHRFDFRIPTADRGPVIGAYCVARFTAGGAHVEWMGIDEIEAIKKRSRAHKFGPWVTDEAQMQRKTVIRRAKNYWPLTGAVELSRAFQLDDQADTGDRPSDDLVFDAEFNAILDTIPETVDEDGASQSRTDELAGQLTK